MNTTGKVILKALRNKTFKITHFSVLARFRRLAPPQGTLTFQVVYEIKRLLSEHF